MKKRILACLLMMCMLVTMLPATAFAAEEVAPTDEPTQNEAVCICDALCTEEMVNADCPVCGGESGYTACTGVPAKPEENDSSIPWMELTPAEQIQSAADGLLSDAAENNNYEVADSTGFTDAISLIANSNASEATITLTQNVTLPGVDELGVEGKHITITSSDADTFLLTLKKNALRLTGNVTFENIHISADTIYAEGNSLTLGAGFGGGNDGQTRMTVCGGSDKDLTANTHVVVEDGVYKLISGGNSAGTLTGSTYVEFGGNARFPTAADGKQQGDYSTGSSEGYNLYQKAEMESSWNPVLVSYTKHGVLPYGIYGGGINADTTGDTTVKMTGGEVYQIFGGGAAIWNPRYAKPQHKNGCVERNTNVTVAGGEVKSIYGGGYNGIDAFGGDDYEKVPDDARSTRAVVEGTAYVTIEGDALIPACEQSEDASTSGCDPAAIHGGSFHSTVGATQVVVGGNVRIETGGKKDTDYGYGSLFGAGANDIVLNTTSVTLKDNARIGRDANELGTTAISQGYFGNMTPLGYAAKSGCYIGGATFNYGSEIKNQGNSGYAATATVAGGQVDVLGIGCKSRLNPQAPKSVTGNVLLQQTGGNIAAIEASCINNKKVTVHGDIDVKVSGGTVHSYIMGRYPTMYDDDRTITGNVILEVSAFGADRYQKIPLLETMDHITIKNGAKVAVEGNWRSYDYKGKYTESGKPGLIEDIPFFQVKGLTVENGAALALTQKSLIEGNITVNGQLGIKRSNGLFGLDAGAKAPVTAEGIAVGNGTLLPFENNRHDQGSTPKVNEEYVYAKKDGSSMQLTLANAGNTGLYVDRKGNTDAQDVWYIAKQAPQNVTVTFDKNGGDTEAKPNQMTVPSGSTVGKLPTAPTRENYTFKGWNTAADGKGQEFTAATTVTSNITVYAQWERKNTPVDPKVAAYRVEHYQEQLDGNYTLSATEFPLYGEIGTTVTAVPKTYEHYHVNHEKSNLTGIVKMPTAGEDGTPEILTLKVYYDLDTVTVSYDLNGGTGKDGISYAPETVKYGASVTIKDAPSKSGYTFEGWSDGTTTHQPGDVLTVLGNITLTAQWHKNSSGGSSGGGGGTTYYILHYESNGGTEYKDERYKKNTVVELDKVPTREGYTFTGWYADEELTDRITSIKMTSDKTVYAGWEPTGVPDWLNGKDHFAYVVGYMDGTVRPLNNISRAEVATIFFRLLNEDIREENLTSVNTFADVNDGMWCNMAISTMAKLGVVKGRTAEHFDPNAPITRAEFAAICARFDTSKRTGDSDFTDISGHWAEAEIERAASLGWIMGYTDGTFRPENYITRAEAMTMINRVLNRLPEDEDDLLDGMNVWPDNKPGDWYYLAVQEATNSHDFTRKGDVHERWTKMTVDPDWSRYQ